LTAWTIDWQGGNKHYWVAERVTLAKSVLSSIQVYSMQILYMNTWRCVQQRLMQPLENSYGINPLAIGWTEIWLPTLKEMVALLVSAMLEIWTILLCRASIINIQDTQVLLKDTIYFDGVWNWNMLATQVPLEYRKQVANIFLSDDMKDEIVWGVAQGGE